MKFIGYIKNIFNKRKSKIEEDVLLDNNAPSVVEEKHKLEILGISHTSDSNIYIVILGENNGGDRKVPVVVTYNEAQSIAIELEKIQPVIPIIYDVLKKIISDNNLSYKEIVISDLKNDILITHLIGDNDSVEIRTADALSVSVRMAYPIYILDSVLEKVDELVKKYYDIKRSDEKDLSFSSEDFKSLSLSDLRDLLNKAILNEEYEKASEIRDEINKKKGKK